MQSGISVSQELVSEFNALLANEKHFGLLATITSETLQPYKTLTPSTGAFATDLSTLLAPELAPKQPLYILLRRFPTAPRFVAISYIPDAAAVRQKMLFAATRLTLVRELGTEHFRETVFATTPEELTARGFERHDAHARLEAPLTEEERSLGEVKKAEMEAGQGTGQKEIHMSGRFAMPIGAGCVDALKELDGGSNSLVMLRIDPESEEVKLVPSDAKPSTLPELVQSISATEPRFTFFRFAHEHAGASSSPILFFYTCPAATGRPAIKARMLYPLMKRAVLEIAEKDAGIAAEKKFEFEDPSEITEEAVLGELHPKPAERKGFSRPKRPGR